VPKNVNHRIKSNKPNTNLGIYKHKSQVSLASGEEGITRQGQPSGLSNYQDSSKNVDATVFKTKRSSV